MTSRIGTRRALTSAVLLLVLVGCVRSAPQPAEAVPAHPFPRWVSQLEVGVTSRGEVEAVFGAPAEVDQHRGGGLLWRYAYAEVHWAGDDPDRPPVAADGQPRDDVPRTFGQRSRTALRATGEFLDRLLFYPPRRVTGPATRTMPATMHRLDLVFDREGVLHRFHYAPRPERVRVSTGG